MHRILFLTVGVGGGHITPARAMASALEARFPDRLTAEVVDLPLVAGASRIDERLNRAWIQAARHPAPMRILYWLLTRLPRTGLRFARWHYRALFEAGIPYLVSKDPDLVVSTHPLCSMVALEARANHDLRFLLLTYVVDPFDAYPWWAARGVDLFLVASKEARDGLVRYDIDPSRIRIAPFPVRPEILTPSATREEVCLSLGLSPDLPVLLCTGGGMGLGKIGRYVEALVRARLPLNIILLTGRNRALYERMRALSGPDSRLVALEFTDRMADLYHTADLVVGKAGASTAMEALVVGRPMLFTEWIAQNDYAIIRYFLDHGYGWYLPGVRRALRFLSRADLLSLLVHAKARIKEAGFTTGVYQISDLIVSILEGGEEA
ncbi:Glycosyltransferase 28 domain-containing protein [Spirochaeta thermophila DSM 6578]|uniref:Glycosyltransferase 28 domain-containing protein n=1 Tax=Winmispira thermophila (strain ATCC 700085 / DSM 6578 / Z-1203) TaxID=869211 RepID=G0GEK6_WINT7|nr:glycosyltransferase [Spirochaeta thermophila]AEJ60694.1 Glycosyltransferase 28 domain-containing protein [Spirochaeta thermophila DSM 6578]